MQDYRCIIFQAGCDSRTLNKLGMLVEKLSARQAVAVAWSAKYPWILYFAVSWRPYKMKKEEKRKNVRTQKGVPAYA